jgi:hypothetical protein
MIRRQSVLTTIVAVVLSQLAMPLAQAGNHEEPSDSAMVLKGGELGTAFKSLRVEGEDQIRIEFERPSLELSIDPLSAPGLDGGSIDDLLTQNGLELVPLFVQDSALERPPYFARPWLDGFATNGVARFRPATKRVESWSLIVANSAGETVATFDGKGKPPEEITWDGRSTDGVPALPGLTYSYAFEAVDRAGNKRNVVGDGFELPAYRLTTNDGMVLLFAGDELSDQNAHTASAILLETASWLNQLGNGEATIRVESIGRSFKGAKKLADSIVAALTPLIVGDPVRLQSVATVEPNAPVNGSIKVSVAK